MLVPTVYVRARSNLILIGVFALLTEAASGQARPATDLELDLIREAYMLDEIRDTSHRRVLEVQGAFTGGSGERPARLDGWVYFAPYRAQATLCMMEASFVTGLSTGNEYDWSLERFAYWNWQLDDGKDCEIEQRSDLPERAVQSSEPIPSAAMSYILVNSIELLALAYDHVSKTPVIDESARERMLGYRNNGTYSPERISITQQSSPDFGFAYRMTFRADGELEGPAVWFSVTPSGFVVHNVGMWIA